MQNKINHYYFISSSLETGADADTVITTTSNNQLFNFTFNGYIYWVNSITITAVDADIKFEINDGKQSGTGAVYFLKSGQTEIIDGMLIENIKVLTEGMKFTYKAYANNRVKI